MAKEYEYGLSELLDSEAMTEDEFLSTYCLDSLVPGICEECGATYNYEPDSADGFCEQCRSNSVVSGLVLMGMI